MEVRCETVACELDSITGTIGEAQQNEAGQWIVSEARMAYGDPMLYLTADDKAGVTSNAEHVKRYLEAHFIDR